MRNQMVIEIDTLRITGADAFHDLFAQTFGFPIGYGRTMDAWVDCMTDLDAGSNSQTSVQVSPGMVVVLRLRNADEFRRRQRELFDEFVVCSAFVNERRIQQAQPAILALSFV